MPKKTKKKDDDGVIRQQSGSSPDGYDDQFVDALLTLFDLSGFFDSTSSGGGGDTAVDNNDGEKKNKLAVVASLLRRLALLLQSNNNDKEQNNAPTTAEDDDDESQSSSFLLLIEDTATKLRGAIRSYRCETLPKEKSALLAVRQSLESISASASCSATHCPMNNNITIPWVLLGRSLSLSLLQQIRKEDQMLRELEEKVLDALYYYSYYNEDTASKNNTNNEQITNFIYDAVDGILDRKSSMEVVRTEYKEAANILQEYLASGTATATTRNDISGGTPASSFLPPLLVRTLPAEQTVDQVASAYVNKSSSSPTAAPRCCWSRIAKEMSIDGALEVFFDDDLREDSSSSSSSAPMNNDDSRTAGTKAAPAAAATATFLLVNGPEGSGKTYICDKAERSARDSGVLVIRPRIPLDFLGRSVGDTEDSIISVLCAAYSCSSATTSGGGRRRRRRVMVILDDIDHILMSTATTHNQQDNRSDTHQIGGESHMMKRSRATFLNMMDVVREKSGSAAASSVLVLCTSRSGIVGSLASRFDRIYYLDLPRETDLREMIIATLGLTGEILDPADDSGLGSLLASTVESSVGKSYAEIAQYCREAVEAVSRNHDGVGLVENFGGAVLKSLKSRLLSITPASLRDTMLDDQIDLRVMSAADLGVRVATGGDIGGYELPLQGRSTVIAWKALESSIVIPLCRSSELRDLLYGDKSGSQRMVTGGVLISGPSGCGKSSIALHCAKYAASLLPSLKVLDVSCTSLIHKEVGGSERAVHHLFDAARRAAPCIVLMDGIENIAAVRGNDTTTEGTMDRVLSTLLVELDGDDTQRSPNSELGGIAVIGITQNDFWVDPAIKRPGRLEKVVRMEMDWI